MNAQPGVHCVVCDQRRTASSARWFYLTENRWTDRLKIFSFQESSAHRPDHYNACCASHVRELVVHWMTTGRLNYPFARIPGSGSAPAGRRALYETAASQPTHEPEPFPAPPCLGELAVHREGLTRILRQNPQALAAVLETLVRALEPLEEQPDSEPPAGARHARVQETTLV